MKLTKKQTYISFAALGIFVAAFAIFGSRVVATGTSVNPFFNASTNDVQHKQGNLALIGEGKTKCVLENSASDTDVTSVTISGGASYDCPIVNPLDSSSDYLDASAALNAYLPSDELKFNVGGITDVDILDIDGDSHLYGSLLVGLDANSSNAIPDIPDVNGDGTIDAADIDNSLIAAGSLGAESLVYTSGDAVSPDANGQRHVCADQNGSLYPCNPAAPNVPNTYEWITGYWQSCSGETCQGTTSQTNYTYKKPNGFNSDISGNVTSLAAWDTLVQNGTITYTNGNVWRMQNGTGGGNLQSVAGANYTSTSTQYGGGLRTVWRLSSACFSNIDSASCIWQEAEVNTGSYGLGNDTVYPTVIYDNQLTGDTEVATAVSNANVACSSLGVSGAQCNDVSGCTWKGTKTRAVECKDVNDNVDSTGAECSATEPSSTAECGPYWFVGGWGNCSSGTQSRVVQCRDIIGGSILSQYECDGSAPASTQSCSLTGLRDWNGNTFTSYVWEPAGTSGPTFTPGTSDPIAYISALTTPAVFTANNSGELEAYANAEAACMADSVCSNANGAVSPNLVVYTFDGFGCDTANLDTCNWTQRTITAASPDPYTNFIDNISFNDVELSQAIYQY